MLSKHHKALRSSLQPSPSCSEKIVTREKQLRTNIAPIAQAALYHILVVGVYPLITECAVQRRLYKVNPGSNRNFRMTYVLGSVEPVDLR